jgi:hypothetical protein
MGSARVVQSSRNLLVVARSLGFMQTLFHVVNSPLEPGVSNDRPAADRSFVSRFTLQSPAADE